VTAIELRVNGSMRAVDAPPDTPLLWVLRGELGLTGAKYGCGLNQCGSCHVLVDGESVAACQLPIGRVGGRAITTVEGLGNPDALHPVQRAFVAETAAQCGFCIPGIVVTTAALLAHNPNPTDDEIRQALAGHLCRCGAHTRILRAVRRAARELEEASS